MDFMRVVRTACILVLLVCAGPLFAEDFSAALASGKVTARFSGNGGSSGDSINAVVEKSAKAGAGAITLTIAPGTRLQSRSASDQNMVVAGVRGRSMGGDSYTPASAIEVPDSGSATYILEGYCMDFEKDNPSANTAFSVGSPDPVLAAILGAAEGLSTAAKQSAVWIYTDHSTYGLVNEKFHVSKEDWAAAEAAVRKAKSRSE